MSIINPTTSPLLDAKTLLQPASAGLSPSNALFSTSALPEQDFTGVLKSMILDVNRSQQGTRKLAAAFERGQHQDLASVMITQQKARLAFQTTLQVRNKLVTAYQDIMNMPV